MIEAQAVVLRVKGNLAWVRLSDQPGGCGRCDEPGGCRSTKIAYALKGPKEEFSLPNPDGIEVGARVRIRMEDGMPLRGALASYGLASVLLLAGAAFGHLVGGGQGDLHTLVGAAGGLAGALAINRLLLRSRQWRTALQTSMVRDDASCATGPGVSP